MSCGHLGRFALDARAVAAQLCILNPMQAFSLFWQPNKSRSLLPKCGEAERHGRGQILRQSGYLIIICCLVARSCYHCAKFPGAFIMAWRQKPLTGWLRPLTNAEEGQIFDILWGPNPNRKLEHHFLKRTTRAGFRPQSLHLTSSFTFCCPRTCFNQFDSSKSLRLIC
jgi:hypothetical protein